MENQPWLEAVRREFARRKLPPPYANRLLSELSDHFHDFMEDRMSKDAPDLQGTFDQLGSPNDIGAQAAEQFRRQRFSGRHPFLAFAVLPIVSLPILFVALPLGVFWALSLIIPEDVVDMEATWPLLAFRLVTCVSVLLPACALAGLSCRAARKAEIGRKWPAATCVLLALMAGTLFTSTREKTADKPGMLMFGIGAYPTTGLQFAQLAAPLTVGAWALLRHRGRSESMFAN